VFDTIGVWTDQSPKPPPRRLPENGSPPKFQVVRTADSGPSPIGHGPIELDSNIWIWLQRTPVAVAVVSLAVMCSYGPDKLLGAFE
jgi:hypothetical protein